MRRSAESWQFILPVIATISIISILLACAQDLTGPATENRNSGAQPTDLALRGARVPADAANPSSPRELHATGGHLKTVPSGARRTLGDGTPVVFAAEFNEPTSGENVFFEYLVDGTGTQVTRANLYSEGQRIYGLQLQWASNGTDLAEVTQTAYYNGQAEASRQSGMSCDWDEFGRWRCYEATHDSLAMRLHVGDAVRHVINRAAGRIVRPGSSSARFQGSTGCSIEGVRAIAEWALIAIDAKHAMQTGGTPVLTAPPSNTNLAFACLLTAGRRAVDGAVYDVRQMAQEAAWTAGYVTWRAFLTGRYIWDTQLRPALSGAAQESYQIFLRDAASCDATAARYVCSSLSAYFNMQ